MSTDMSEFHEAFYEESFEAVDSMEAGLLELNTDDPDIETVNTIFRGAHSMKGGAGMFGFTDLAAFTHTTETLLDQIRDGTRTLDEQLRELFLKSVDVCRAMLTGLQSGENVDPEVWEPVKKSLDSTLAGSSAVAPSTSGDPELGVASEDDHAPQWLIKFAPRPNLLQNGNEPARLFRELEAFGETEVKCDPSALPTLSSIEPENCYLVWTIILRATVTEVQIREVFEWVEDDCDLLIEQFEAPAVESCLTEPADSKSTEVESSSQSIPKAASAPKATRGENSQSGSIRVSTDKVDALINMVGELVITQSMLNRFSKGLEEGDLEDLRSGLTALERNTRELQEGATFPHSE